VGGGEFAYVHICINMCIYIRVYYIHILWVINFAADDVRRDLAVAVCYGVLQCVAVRCSALRCVAVCCSVLQCVAVTPVTILRFCVFVNVCIWPNVYLYICKLCTFSADEQSFSG